MYFRETIFTFTPTTPPPRNNTLDVILEADDRIYGALDEDQRAAVDEQAIDPLSHLDESLLDIFMELDR